MGSRFILLFGLFIFLGLSADIGQAYRSEDNSVASDSQISRVSLSGGLGGPIITSLGFIPSTSINFISGLCTTDRVYSHNFIHSYSYLDICDNMSHNAFMSQMIKYSKTQALKKIRQLLKNDCEVLFTGHSIKELKNDNLDRIDVLNVLMSESARITDEPEFIHNSWRYRLKTNTIIVVVVFMINANGIIVVTVFKIKSTR